MFRYVLRAQQRGGESFFVTVCAENLIRPSGFLTRDSSSCPQQFRMSPCLFFQHTQDRELRLPRALHPCKSVSDGITNRRLNGFQKARYRPSGDHRQNTRKFLDPPFSLIFYVETVALPPTPSTFDLHHRIALVREFV
jgi:hypothetical protein